MIGRQLTEPLVIDGKDVPVGTTLVINLHNLHHNPAVWEDPERYDPDRFLPERMAKMDTHAWMAFAAGPRNCIGQNSAMAELKTIIARVLRRFDLKLDPEQEQYAAEIDKAHAPPGAKPMKMRRTDVESKPFGGLYLHFNERK